MMKDKIIYLESRDLLINTKNLISAEVRISGQGEEYTRLILKDYPYEEDPIVDETPEEIMKLIKGK